MVKLRCGVYGEGIVFSVEVEGNADVEALQVAIADRYKVVSNLVEVYPATLTLYLAKKNGTWLKSDPTLKPILKQGRQEDSDYEEMIPNWILDKDYLGATFSSGRKEIHVLGELPTDKFDVKRQRVEHSTSLADLWEHSELQLVVLPAPHKLVELLQKPLPFKLILRDSVAASGVFDPDGPLLTYPDLTLLMNNFCICAALHLKQKRRRTHGKSTMMHCSGFRIPCAATRTSGFECAEILVMKQELLFYEIDRTICSYTRDSS